MYSAAKAPDLDRGCPQCSISNTGLGNALSQELALVVLWFGGVLAEIQVPVLQLVLAGIDYQPCGWRPMRLALS